VTLNEPMVPALGGNLTDEFPPQRKSFDAFRRVTGALLEAHARLYKIIHDRVPTAAGGGPTQVGVAQAYQWIVPWGSPGFPGLIENLAARIFSWGSFNGWDQSIVTGKQSFPFGGRDIPGLKNSYDYCGINYYFRMSLKYNPERKDQFRIDEKQIPPGIDKTQMGWQIYPPGFYQVIRLNWERFRKPIYITENGCADDADTIRPAYLLQHLAAVHRAISDGIPVKGYFQWSFTDNFEWREGFSKKFGLVAVDAVNDPELKRVPRGSAHMYSEIIRENGITQDIVKRYAPDAMDAVFGNKWDWSK
jgi:beta-glucosidase